MNTALQTGLVLGQTGLTVGVLVTAIFVAIPLVCGAWVRRCADAATASRTLGRRFGLAVVGVLTLLTWGGSSPPG